MNAEQPPTVSADALLIDLDGTLVDSTEAVDRCWRDWCDRRGVDPEDVFRISEGRQAWSVIEELRPDLDAHAEDRWLIDLQLERLDGVRAIAGAADFTQALEPDGWAIVTSCTHDLARGRLKAAGLQLPRVFIGAEDVKRSKPHPDGFQLAAERLGVAPERCLVFEDSSAGLEAARRAGMPSVAITAAARHAPPDGQLSVPDWRCIEPAGPGRWNLRASGASQTFAS